MTMTRETARIWDEYVDREMTGECKVANTVDKAMGQVLRVFRESGLAFPGDDRCASVEALIYKLAKECNPKHFREDA